MGIQKLIKLSPWSHGICRIKRRAHGWGKDVWGKGFGDENRGK